MVQATTRDCEVFSPVVSEKFDVQRTLILQEILGSDV